MWFIIHAGIKAKRLLVKGATDAFIPENIEHKSMSYNRRQTA